MKREEPEEKCRGGERKKRKERLGGKKGGVEKQGKNQEIGNRLKVFLRKQLHDRRYAKYASPLRILQS